VSLAPASPEAIIAFAARRCGTSLSRQQRERLERAIAARLGDRTPEAYLAHLQLPQGAFDLAELLSVVSVHKTDLFRDEQQLEALKVHVLSKLAGQARPLKVWSAGCATGEEVATLLVLLAEAGAHPESTVLGTDISGAALERARQLTFDAGMMKRVPKELVARYFVRSHSQGGPAEATWSLAPSLARRARFQVHNLMDTPYPIPDGRAEFDVIVCRNVLIYFTPESTDAVVSRLAERLDAGGTLVLSAAEPILKPVVGLHTQRHGNVFFYGKGSPPPSEDLKVPPRPSSPSPPPRPSAPVGVSAPPRTMSVEIPAVPPPPAEEGQKLFELVMEWAAAGTQSDAEAEAGLRKALYLAPELAAARYLLGLLLEHRGAKADSASEYRRALAMLESGKATVTAFYLNHERLKGACQIALKRLGYTFP
jgi:chemotaxis protein methyltransferase CheR